MEVLNNKNHNIIFRSFRSMTFISGLLRLFSYMHYNTLQYSFMTLSYGKCQWREFQKRVENFRKNFKVHDPMYTQTKIIFNYRVQNPFTVHTSLILGIKSVWFIEFLFPKALLGFSVSGTSKNLFNAHYFKVLYCMSIFTEVITYRVVILCPYSREIQKHALV